jgi:hypothetical protein
MSADTPDVPMSGDLLTTLTVEPGRLGRLLDAAALWTSPEKTLPGVQAIIVRIDATARTVRAVGTDRYRLLDASMALGEYESIGGDPVMHDLWIPAPIARRLAKDLRGVRWPTHAKRADQRIIEIRIERAAFTHASTISLPPPFAAMCKRAGVLSFELSDGPVSERFGQPSKTDGSYARSQGIMRLADSFAAAEPITGPDAGEPFALNSRLFADLDRIAPCAKSQHVRPWTFQAVRTSTRTTAVRVVPKHSPHPTDGVRDLEIVGHIMPIRLGVDQ